jgi:hypothetical protein
MYNIDHYKMLISAELEALVAEVKELKERVTELEHKEFHTSIQDNKEFIGKWIDKTKVTCKDSFIG